MRCGRTRERPLRVADDAACAAAAFACCAKCPDPVVEGNNYVAAARDLRACFSKCSKRAELFDKRVEFVLARADVCAAAAQARMRSVSSASCVFPPANSGSVRTRVIDSIAAQEKVEECLGACDALIRSSLPLDMGKWTPEAQVAGRAKGVDCRVRCYNVGAARMPAVRAEFERE